MSLKPWRENVVPHEDVRKGTFQQAEFAADLTRVHDGTAASDYQDSRLFFQRTFITEGMHLLLDSVIKRLAGQGGDPVIQLQTAFGGGKTHTMLAVYHLAAGKVPTSDLSGIPAILDAAGVTEVPLTHIAVLDGTNHSPNQPFQRDGILVKTLWGNLAWQLGGADGFAFVADADGSGTSPSKDVLIRLLEQYAPCVILVDELVAYIRQFEDGKTLTGGTFDSNLSFVQSLTEALKAVPTAVMLASLPESAKEAGGQRGRMALETLSHTFGRVQALWKPVATEEAFEIVRRRLFHPIQNPAAAESVCRDFATYYADNGSAFPRETQESTYYDRMLRAYPIHPEVFDRLYDDWSTLDNFQRTRGVLKLMAKVIHRLWEGDNKDALIMPGSLPLYDADTRNEAIYYLPQGWDPVVERDIDGDRAETAEIENQDTRLGSIQACRRSARAIFLGSAPSTVNQMNRGVEVERIHLGVAQPGQSIGLYQDALRRMQDRLHYLNVANHRYWFDTRPNLRREMESRKSRFNDKEDVLPALREQVRSSFVGTSSFGGIHVFTGSADVPDDWQVRLVVLGLDGAYNRNGHGLAVTRALDILKNHGDQPRQKQNRLLFLAPDYDITSRLREQVKTWLAWQSIVTDLKDGRLNLDQYQSRQSSDGLADAKATMQRMIREAYRWLLAPFQQPIPGKTGISEIQWEQHPLNTASPNLTQEIERVLKENELLIMDWAPIHLGRILKDWFWKNDVTDVHALEVWQKTCQYLFLPRLKDDRVFQCAISGGTGSTDFFGVAQGKEGDRFLGFSFGRSVVVALDASLLLIAPDTAATYAEAILAAAKASKPSAQDSLTTTSSTETLVPSVSEATGGFDLSGARETETLSLTKMAKHQFYGRVDLDPVLAKLQFANIIEEVIQHFTTQLGVQVEIKIEVQATSSAGFDDVLQRIIKENCRSLKFGGVEFE